MLSTSHTRAIPLKRDSALACVHCYQRKVKCDRDVPCSECIKIKMRCTPRIAAHKRSRRQVRPGLQERLARCEELVKQYQETLDRSKVMSPIETSPIDLPTVPSNSISLSKEVEHVRKSACKMITENDNVRFIDNFIWASISDELQDIRDIVETNDLDNLGTPLDENHSPGNTDLFIPGYLSTSNLEDLTPNPVQSCRLWQIFLDRVNPLTKLIHVPTVQHHIVEATTNMASLPFHIQALVFSIYNMATISLSDIECHHLFGMNKEVIIQKFTAGTKISLIRQNYLKNYNMTVLQALVLFSYSLHGRYDPHATWILGGIMVRIAQKMGLHRDGELLHLEPFETEMRRRVWWQIIIQDSNNGIKSGLNQTCLPVDCDTRLPQNVRDADMLPGSSGFVRPCEGPTDMAFCLLLNEIYNFKIDIDNSDCNLAVEATILGRDLGHGIEASVLHRTALDGFRVKAEALKRKLIELEGKYVDLHAGGVHKAALIIRPMITDKLGEMLVPMRNQPEWGGEISSPKDNLFKVVIIGNEQKAHMLERLDGTDFLWFSKMHFQLDLFIVLAGQLCQRPFGSLADRGWVVTERLYRHYPELLDVSHKMYSVPAKIFSKAWQIRESAYTRVGQIMQPPQFIRYLRDNIARLSTTPSNLRPPAAQGHMQQPLRQYQHQHIKLHSPIEDIDLFVNGHLDISTLNWDVFHSMVENGSEPASGIIYN